MKRILALLLAMLLLFCMVACGSNDKDEEEEETKPKHPAKEPAQAIEALEENGYEVVENSTSFILDMMGFEGLETLVTAKKYAMPETEEGETLPPMEDSPVPLSQMITIFYFEDADSAEAEMEDIEALAEESNEFGLKNWVCKRSGAMIYFGTAQAAKDAR